MSAENNSSNIVINWMNQIRNIAKNGYNTSPGGSMAETYFYSIMTYCDAVITSLTSTQGGNENDKA